jgi:hypothetical protein
MTARISVNGELRVHGREVEIIVKPRWTHADLDAAESLAGAPVRITVEPVPPPPEPLTGGDADINARVRVKNDCPDPGFVGSFGTLVEYGSTGAAVVRFDNGSWFSMPRCYVERAPAECPHCGASQVTR